MSIQAPAPDEKPRRPRSGGALPRDVAELLEFFHSTPPVFRDEQFAPEVDHDTLLSLVRQELPEETARCVYILIYSLQELVRRAYGAAYRRNASG